MEQLGTEKTVFTKQPSVLFRFNRTKGKDYSKLGEYEPAAIPIRRLGQIAREGFSLYIGVTYVNAGQFRQLRFP